MADRYQDKPFSADDDYDRDSHRHPVKGDSDPLAELARLIGQTDPFSNFGRANQPVPAAETDPYHRSEPEPDIEQAAAGPPPWMQRMTQQETPQQQDFDTSVHPLRRYAAARPAVEPHYHEALPFAEPDQHPQADPARYDDALYGEPDPGTYDAQHDAGYADDPYAYQDGYEEQTDSHKPRRGGMITVVAVLALAVVGTGGAFAYRTFAGASRSGEPPIIKADAGPTKIVPAPSGDGVAKVPDRIAPGGAEKIVPREETPVDVNAATPRVVFPPLNQNANPPSVASVAVGAKPPAASANNGTLAGDEPRKIRTLAVKGDPADVAATPAPKPAAAPRPVPSPAVTRAPSPVANANASAGNGPLSLSPQGAQSAADTRTNIASNNVAQAAPSGGGNYVVQVSSQRSEADAQASYRSLQGKFPSVLGSRPPLIKRADLGEKGVYYRAMVGPFASSEEAAQVCGNLKTAGGQCVVQKN